MNQRDSGISLLFKQVTGSMAVVAACELGEILEPALDHSIATFGLGRPTRCGDFGQADGDQAGE
jgi:hypothetical protein